MTIEIRELVIRAVAEARPGDPHAVTATPTDSPAPAAPLAAADPLDREAMVARVVREVLRELKRSRDR